ncbi:MAG: S8 family peptidase [bacterium]
MSIHNVKKYVYFLMALIFLCGIGVMAKAQIFLPLFPFQPWSRLQPVPSFLPLPALLTRQRKSFNAFVPNECIIQFKPGVSPAEISRICDTYGVLPFYRSPYAGFIRAKIFSLTGTVGTIMRLCMEPAILYAEPNYIAETQLIPNDPLYIYQWGMPGINTPLAWNIANGSGVIVAVLDTGIAYENNGIYALAPDLAGTLFIPGYDFVNVDAFPDDDQGHGTHITGTIAQTTNNLTGCAGVAFGASIMPVKVLGASGTGVATDISDGLYYAANNGAKIINMSFGFGNNPSLTLETAIDYASTAGALPICSGGNYANSLPNYPAAYTPCVSVTATLLDRTFASYSSYGLTIDLCAPGGDLTLDQNLDGYADGILQQSHNGVNFTVFDYYLGKGTSWSAAFVSGVAALVCSVNPLPMTPLEIRTILETTAIDLGLPGWDEYYGNGLVDAFAAVSAVLPSAVILSTTGLVPFLPL